MPAPTIADPANIHGMCGTLKGSAYYIQCTSVMQIGETMTVKTDMVEMLRHREKPEILHYPGIPAGHIMGQLFKNRRGTFPSPVCQCIRHICPLAEIRGRYGMKCLCTDEIADIRNHPFFAGLDKEVVIEAANVLLECICLLFNDREKSPEDLPPSASRIR